MAAKTTVKVATLTGAAKDDNLLSSVTGVNEDHLSGNLNVLANDPGSAHLYSLKQDVSGLAGTATFPAVSTAFSAAGATISINADGTIAYDASNLNLQHLAEGVAYTDSFTYTVQMANGAYSTAVAHVELMGVNDAPTLAAIAAATINDTAADDTPAPITGTLLGADVDDGAVLTYAVTGTSALGVVAVDGANYSFTADANAIDALQQGESATATFTATVTDEHGASASRTMEFTLVGANDTAEFGGVAAGSVTEDGTLTTSGTVTVADRDHDQSAYQAATPAALTGAHGTFTFAESTGVWGYTLNNADAAVQALNTGASLTDTLTVSSIDGSTQDIVVTINGADEPVVVPPADVVPPATVSHNFMVNRGLQVETGHVEFNNFASADQLHYSANLTQGAVSQIDFIADPANAADSTQIEFSYLDHLKGGATETVTFDVVLVGYTGAVNFFHDAV
jgi:VCBS repeat-containing protein